MATTDKLAAARTFLRSLNIAFKFVRLYGFEHARVAEQLRTAENELRAAIPAGSQQGLLIGTNSSQLVLDGVVIQPTPAEHNIAQVLATAQVTSVQFLPSVTQEELGNFVRAILAGSTRGLVADGQPKEPLADAGGIRFTTARGAAENVPASVSREGTPGAKRTPIIRQDKSTASEQAENAHILRSTSAQTTRGKLIDAISNAGAKETDKEHGIGKRVSQHDTHLKNMPEGPNHYEQEIVTALRLLVHVAKTSNENGESLTGLEALRQQLGEIPERSRHLLQQALATLAGQTLTMRANDPMLLRLAEHLAVRFALDRYERGAGVTRIRHLLERMGEEISPLWKLPSLHGKTIAETGIRIENPAELLDRQFWSAVPKPNQYAVVTSADAWCVPPRNLRQQFEEMVEKNDPEAAAVLENYVRAVNHPEAHVRRRAATGLTELADLYGATEDNVLVTAIRSTGRQLTLERDDTVRDPASTAFVRLAEQATKHRVYGAVLQSLDSLDGIENQRPAFAQTLRERLNLDKHNADFLDEAIRSMPSCPKDLKDVIERLPRSTAENLRNRFNRGTQREEYQRIVEVARTAGAGILARLRESLQVGVPHDAAETVGLLSCLDAPSVEKWLGSRLGQWPRTAQDRAVRLLAASGAPERGHLLLAIFGQLDPLLRPLAIDEIGLSGEPSAMNLLLHLASGGLPKGSGEFLRLKAVEALGRLRVPQAADVLRGIAETKKLWHWHYSTELRIAAVQALREIAPEWVQSFLPRSGVPTSDLDWGPQAASSESPWFRQRRYPRVRLDVGLPATATSERATISMEVHNLSLSGGLATGQTLLTPGTQVALRLGTGLRPVHTQAVMRGARAQTLSFEFENMDLEERARLRRLIREHQTRMAEPRSTTQGTALRNGTAY